MPRARGRGGSKLVNWERKGRRLARLDAPAEVFDSEVMVYNTMKVQQQVLESNIINQPFTTGHTDCVVVNGASDLGGAEQSLDTGSTESECWFSIQPPEILEIIFTFLSVADMEALANVNRRLKNHIESRYILHLMLPCSSELLEQASRKKVLKLTSTRCLFILKDPVTGELPFKHLNLRYLKELKLGGYNRGDTSDRLSWLYLSALKTILNSATCEHLQKLEISCDNSGRFDFFIGVVPRLLNLKEITIRGMNLESAAYFLNPDFSVIESVLRSTNVEKVSMEGFEIEPAQPCTLFLSSKTVQELNLDLGKTFDSKHQIKVDLPNLKRMRTVSPSCLYHALKNQLMLTLASGAPKLQYYNDIDLLNLPGAEGYSSWLEQLKAEGDTINYCLKNKSTCFACCRVVSPREIHMNLL